MLFHIDCKYLGLRLNIYLFHCFKSFIVSNILFDLSHENLFAVYNIESLGWVLHALTAYIIEYVFLNFSFPYTINRCGLAIVENDKSTSTCACACRCYVSICLQISLMGSKGVVSSQLVETDFTGAVLLSEDVTEFCISAVGSIDGSLTDLCFQLVLRGIVSAIGGERLHNIVFTCCGLEDVTLPVPSNVH